MELGIFTSFLIFDAINLGILSHPDKEISVGKCSVVEEVHALVVADLVHVLPLPHGVHLLHTNECLGQGNWTKSSIKEEQTNAMYGFTLMEKEKLNILKNV